MKKNNDTAWTDFLVIRRYALVIFLLAGLSLGLSTAHPIFFLIAGFFIILMFYKIGSVSNEEFKKMLTSMGYIKIKRRKK